MGVLPTWLPWWSSTSLQGRKATGWLQHLKDPDLGDQFADRLPPAWHHNAGPPPQAADNKSLKRALAAWQETYNAYIDAGGPPMDFEEGRTQLLKILPTTLRLELFKNLRDYTSIPQITEWIRVEAEYEQE